MHKLLIAAVGLLTLAAPAVAGSRIEGTGTLETVVREVSRKQKEVRTLEASFRQTKEMDLLAEPEVSTGTFAFAAPSRVLWNYKSPKPVQMSIADGWLTTYYPHLNRAEKVSVKGYQDRIFRYMAAGAALEELSRYFDFRFVDSKAKSEYRLELTPKSRTLAKRVRAITIWIDRSSYLTTKFEYVEGNGDRTRYEFFDIRVNLPIGAERFSLNLPPTVRIQQVKFN